MAGRKNIYIDDETEPLLDELAQLYGDHSKVIRAAVQRLAEWHKQPDAPLDPLVQIEGLSRQIQGIIQGVWTKQDLEDDD